MILDFKTNPASDGSVKYRFKTEDEHLIEATFFYFDTSKVACLSTQIGCNMGCKFCATGLKKSVRNLTKEEILEQAELISFIGLQNGKLDSVTLAGMGEPLANYDNAIEALETFRSINTSASVSLSTVGLVDKIWRLFEEKRSIGLFVSLHAADDSTRQMLIPAAKSNPVTELVKAASAYADINPPGMVRMSYLLLEGITDTDEQFKKLVKLVEGKNFMTQIRLWNEIDNMGFCRVTDTKAEEWARRLNSAGVPACVRPSAGRDIMAACGQLAAE